MKSPEPQTEAIVDGKLRLAVDWDGTCVENVWPEKYGEWKPGAIETLLELSEYFHILIYSARTAPVGPDQVTPSDADAEIAAIREQLDEAGLTMVEIHTKPWKPSAIAYVDDRAVHYGGKPYSWYIVKKYLVDTIAPVNGGGT